MKKTYSNPQMEIVKIQTQQMLADSLTKGYNPTAVSAGSVDARGFNFDPDEE